jgi:hypothetical protein
LNSTAILLEGTGILSTSITKQSLRTTVEAKLKSASMVYDNNPHKKIGKLFFLGNELTTVKVIIIFLSDSFINKALICSKLHNITMLGQIKG